MKKLFDENRIKRIIFGLLFVLTFAFFHSELGQFSAKGDKHETHSFSSLINGAVAQNFGTGKICKIKTKFVREISLISYTPDQLLQKILQVPPREDPPKTVKRYISKKSFLI